jgi:hypothetical protein
MAFFKDPRYWLSIAVAVLCISGGLQAGAERYIQRQGLRQRADLGELERFTGMVANLAPWAIATTAAGLTLVWRFCPAPEASDQAALAKLARAKLAQPLLTDAELQLWSTVLDEVTKHHG